MHMIGPTCDLPSASGSECTSTIPGKDGEKDEVSTIRATANVPHPTFGELQDRV